MNTNTTTGPLGSETGAKDLAPRELTFGEQLVGLNFNPSGDDDVTKAKKLCAELADLVAGKIIAKNRAGESSSDLEGKLYDHTVGEILNAQMNVVKFLTLKY